MTDIAAALGLSQLQRYASILARRHEILSQYEAGLAGDKVGLLRHYETHRASSGHLCLAQLTGRDEAFRNAFIRAMAARGVACNVHYKPLPLLTAYRERGFNIASYPNAFAQYQGEVTLPLHTLLSDEDVAYVVEAFKASYAECEHASV
jgi:dTDP-4-amino-4,6-dideoxygalactose transaminase